MKNNTNAKLWSLAAVLMFAVAVFQITSDHFLPGAVFFGAAACFMSAAGIYRKKAAEENRQEVENTELREQ